MYTVMVWPCVTRTKHVSWPVRGQTPPKRQRGSGRLPPRSSPEQQSASQWKTTYHPQWLTCTGWMQLAVLIDIAMPLPHSSRQPGSACLAVPHTSG